MLTAREKAAFILGSMTTWEAFRITGEVDLFVWLRRAAQIQGCLPELGWVGLEALELVATLRKSLEVEKT